MSPSSSFLPLPPPQRWNLLDTKQCSTQNSSIHFLPALLGGGSRNRSTVFNESSVTNIPGVCLATGVRTEIGFCVFSIRSGHTRLALQMVGKEAKIPINYTGGREKSRKEISSKEQKRGEWESKLGNWEEGGRKFRQKNKKLGGGWE